MELPIAYPFFLNILIKQENPRNMKETKKKIYNLILLDESGSMSSDKAIVISNFNELIDDIKHQAKENKDVKQYISLITFNSMGIQVVLDCKKAKEAAPLTDKDYNPGSLTPIYDAMGYAIQNLRTKLKGNSNVITTVFTDGMENSSKEFDANTLKKIIEELENENWSFTYVGADHDVVKQASKLNISKSMRFSKTKEGFKESLGVQKKYREKINSMVTESTVLSKSLKQRIWEDSKKESKEENN